MIAWLAFAALVLTAINMFGGFAVTRRMLAMFRKYRERQEGNIEMSQSLATVAYLGAAILFILSLGGLSNPETSRRGNLLGHGWHGAGGAGHGVRPPGQPLGRWPGSWAALVIGGGIGLYAAQRGEDDANARAGGADAQPGGPGRLPGGLCQLCGYLDPVSRGWRKPSTRWKSTLAS